MICKLAPLLPIQGGELGRQGPRGKGGHRHGTRQPKCLVLPPETPKITHRILYAIELSVRVLADVSENILVHTDALLQQQFDSFVGAMQEASIGVHVQQAIEVLSIVVLHPSDVEVKQLVAFGNVLCSQLTEVNYPKQSCRPNCVPVRGVRYAKS